MITTRQEKYENLLHTLKSDKEIQLELCYNFEREPIEETKTLCIPISKVISLWLIVARHVYISQYLSQQCCTMVLPWFTAHNAISYPHLVCLQCTSRSPSCANCVVFQVLDLSTKEVNLKHDQRGGPQNGVIVGQGYYTSVCLLL